MSDNAAAFSTVHQWVEGLAAAESGYYADAAKRVAEIAKEQIDASIAREQSVSGKPWRPRKLINRGRARADAVGKLLANAAEHVTTKAIGTVVMIILEGPEVFHHFGAGHNPRREIIPSAGLGKLGNAIAAGIVDMGLPWMTRKGRHDKGSGGVKMQPRSAT